MCVYYRLSLQQQHRNTHAQGRPPLRQHGFIKSTPPEGRVAPPPWWWCLSCCLCFLCGFWLVTCQSYLSYVHFRGVTKWPTQACIIPSLRWITASNMTLWHHFHTTINPDFPIHLAGYVGIFCVEKRVQSTRQTMLADMLATCRLTCRQHAPNPCWGG